MAEVSSSGTSGYHSATDSTISYSTVDNQNYSMLVYAYSSNWSSTLRIMQAVITYTISEAE